MIKMISKGNRRLLGLGMKLINYFYHVPELLANIRIKDKFVLN